MSRKKPSSGKGFGAIFSRLRSQKPQIRLPLAVSFGAIAGALSRYYLTLGCNQWLGTAFPYSTLLINLSGAFLMGFFTTLVIERIEVSPDLRILVAVGFLGSYTTFSTYELNAEKLLASGHLEIAALYWIFTATLGVLCLEFGTFIARRLL
jgi:CrcB protein